MWRGDYIRRITKNRIVHGKERYRLSVGYPHYLSGIGKREKKSSPAVRREGGGGWRCSEGG
jgi:hypothetical protein